MIIVVLSLVRALLVVSPVPWAPEGAVGECAADVALVDERGVPFRLAQLRGKVVVLSFISTHCGDVCPLITQRFAQLAALERNNPDVRLVEVSIDPDVDRPATLRAYGARFGVDGTRWRLATGERDAVLMFAARFGAAPLARGGGQQIEHEGRTVVLDTAGRIRAEIDGARWRPADIVSSLAAGFAPLPWWSRLWSRLCGPTGNPYQGILTLMIVLGALVVALASLVREKRSSQYVRGVRDVGK